MEKNRRYGILGFGAFAVLYICFIATYFVRQYHQPDNNCDDTYLKEYFRLRFTGSASLQRGLNTGNGNAGSKNEYCFNAENLTRTTIPGKMRLHLNQPYFIGTGGHEPKIFFKPLGKSIAFTFLEPRTQYRLVNADYLKPENGYIIRYP